MLNTKNFVVFDIETDDKNPRTCNPIQIAALVVHPRKLEIVENSEFTTWIQPDDFHNKDYYKNHKSTIDWHANNHGIKPEEFLEILAAAPKEKIAWASFVDYLKRYYAQGKSKTLFNAPILVGYNIFEFDKIIIDRLCEKYKNTTADGVPNIYNKRDTVDIMKLVFAWFESLQMVQNYSMDHLREVLRINSVGVAHEGLKDCHDEAQIFIRLMALHRRFAQKVTGWY
jgi:DNA polymerase III alpha subunit (gram-positive type)